MKNPNRTRRIRVAILLASIAAAALSAAPRMAHHGAADLLPPTQSADQ